jgi:RNA polymerase sigma-70 factor (ECF subfamily)
MDAVNITGCDVCALGHVYEIDMDDAYRQHEVSGFGLPLDQSTLERARRGDMLAHAAIYARYGSACYNLALRILGEPAAAEDIVQDVFLKMFDSVRGFRNAAPFGAWLKRLTANATIDVLRAGQRFRADAPDTLFASMPASAPDVEERTDAWSLLMRLPPRARAVLILHELEGYTHKELADLFGQSESYSKSVLARARKRLNAIASATGDDEHA